MLHCNADDCWRREAFDGAVAVPSQPPEPQQLWASPMPSPTHMQERKSVAIWQDVDEEAASYYDKDEHDTSDEGATEGEAEVTSKLIGIPSLFEAPRVSEMGTATTRYSQINSKPDPQPAHHQESGLISEDTWEPPKSQPPKPQVPSITSVSAPDKTLEGWLHKKGEGLFGSTTHRWVRTAPM